MGALETRLPTALLPASGDARPQATAAAVNIRQMPDRASIAGDSFSVAILPPDYAAVQ
jgi:hypothetical protein